MQSDDRFPKPDNGLTLEDLARGAGLPSHIPYAPRPLDWILVGILIGMALSAAALIVGAHAGIMAIG